MDVFLRVAVATYNMPNNFPTKACDCRILYVLSGKGKITIENKQFQLKPNTLCYYPTGTKYYPVSSKTEPLYFVTINFDLNRSYSEVKDVRPTVKSELFNPQDAICSHVDCEPEMFRNAFVIEDADRFREQLLNVCEEFDDGRGNEPAASALLQYILLKMSDKRDEDSFATSLYERVVEYINNNYSTIKNNREIAEALSYHDYYINRIFKLKAGETLHKYLLNLRLEKAAVALVDSRLSVGEVAKSVGFYNADHFSKRFYEKYGISPSVYKKQKENMKLV